MLYVKKRSVHIYSTHYSLLYEKLHESESARARAACSAIHNAQCPGYLLLFCRPFELLPLVSVYGQVDGADPQFDENQGGLKHNPSRRPMNVLDSPGLGYTSPPSTNEIARFFRPGIHSTPVDQ